MRRSRCLSSISCANSRFICLTCWYRNCESQESPKIRIMISKPMQNVHQLSTLNKQNEKSNTSLTPHNKESKQAKKITWPCELYFTNHFKTPKKWNETKKKIILPSVLKVSSPHHLRNTFEIRNGICHWINPLFHIVYAKKLN